ncbi:DUF881 domain-containing protein [uncultured Jatrophihabitans sp.]|uniref:DUF881 domain-containing protein n=1 Tax=uncultured Jatrophihabitans sp. TaxID=1610747 RepID=UPI0035CB712F
MKRLVARGLRLRSAALAARRTPWRVLVPVACLVAGLGFAVSARDSAGTDLRAPGSANLVDTVRAAERRVQTLNTAMRSLQAEVTKAEERAGQDNTGVAAAQARSGPLRAPAGLTAVAGPGLLVVLDDAPAQPASGTVDPNQLVVHQSDLQSVVNALWAGGAEAMTIAGQRVIATSAVRCVGNTLLLNGEVFSPPFRVEAIGPAAAMQARLAQSPGVRLFREAATYYGLGYTVAPRGRLSLPAFTGAVTLGYAHADG